MARPGVRPFSEFRNRIERAGVPIAGSTAGHGQIDGELVDRWSIVHFFVGVVAGCIDTHPIVYTAGSVAWEALERFQPGMFPHSTKDSTSNLLGDLLIGALGYGLGNAYRSKIRSS